VALHRMRRGCWSYSKFPKTNVLSSSAKRRFADHVVEIPSLSPYDSVVTVQDFAFPVGFDRFLTPNFG